MITSKLTSKAQTTIPQPVRAALSVRAGDEVAYTIEPGRVILTKAPARQTARTAPREDPFGVFTEWASDADSEAFAKL